MSALPPLIDFHAHILPGADHGSCGIEESLNQLNLMRCAGVATVVATPHFYPHQHPVAHFQKRIHSSAEELIAHLPADAPTICLGAEVLYCHGIHRMEDLSQLCIRGTNLLLLELPLDQWGNELFDTVAELCSRYTVVLAHIDRYLRRQQHEIAELLSLGAYAQINASALFSFSVRRKLLPFWQGDRIVALGSDLHQADKRTYAQFSAACTRLGNNFSVIMQRSHMLLQNAIPLV